MAKSSIFSYFRDLVVPYPRYMLVPIPFSLPDSSHYVLHVADVLNGRTPNPISEVVFPVIHLRTLISTTRIIT